MAFMGVLLVMGLLGVLVGILLFWAAVFMVGALLEGLLVWRLGKALANNALAMANRPGLVRCCRALGFGTMVVSAVEILSMILFLSGAFTTAQADAQSGPVSGAALWMLALIVLGFVLFIVMGVLLTKLAGLNRRLQPPPVRRVTSIACRLLGIANFVLGAIAVFTVGGLVLVLRN